jgi:hypothetical protein
MTNTLSISERVNRSFKRRWKKIRISGLPSQSENEFNENTS